MNNDGKFYPLPTGTKLEIRPDPDSHILYKQNGYPFEEQDVAGFSCIDESEGELLALLLGDNDGDDADLDGSLDEDTFVTAFVAAAFVEDDVLEGRSEVEADFRNESNDDILTEIYSHAM